MKKKAVIFAIIPLIFLTILPLVALRYIPPEIQNLISKQAGLNVGGLVNSIALTGLTMSTLIFLRASIEEKTPLGLSLSISWKIFWLLLILFTLSLGKIENLGYAVLSSQGGPALNVVALDLRLITALIIAIVALKITYAILEFKEANKRSVELKVD